MINEFCTLLSDTNSPARNTPDLLNMNCFEYDSDDTPNCIAHAKYLLDSEFKRIAHQQRKNQFSILHFNARSLPKNFDNIHSYLNSLDFPFSVIGISETWINPNINVNFDIDGYKFIHVDRENGRGGGVGLYVRDDLQYKVHNFSDQCDGVEFLGIEIMCKQPKNLFVMVLYRQPKSNLSSFISFFDKILNDPSINPLNSYIMGDFNIDILKNKNSPLASDFVDSFLSAGFYPLIDRPTRDQRASLIDNIYSNVFHDDMSPGILITDISDHFPIFNVSQYPGTFATNSCNKQKYRKVTDDTLKLFAVALMNTDWCSVLSDQDPEKAYNVFHYIL